MAATVVIAVIALGAALGNGAFPSGTSPADDGGSQPRVSPATTDGEPSFTLIAHAHAAERAGDDASSVPAPLAAEPASAPPTVPVELSLDAFRPLQAEEAEFNPLTEEGDGPQLLSARFLFDATCSGERLTSVTYEVIGEGVFLMFYDEAAFRAAHEARSPGNADASPADGESGGSYEVGTETRFTLPYENGAPVGEARCEVQVVMPLPDGVGMLNDRWRAAARNDDGGEEARLALVDALLDAEAAGLAAASDKVGASTFRLTAAFADGSTLTREYCISPVPDFEQRCRAYLQAHAAGPLSSDGLPSLFTIEELPRP